MSSLLSAAGFLIMVAAIGCLIATQAIFSPHPLVIAIQVAALALMLWARFTLRWRSFHATAQPTAGGLVTSGPYAHIRHPIYTAVCAFVVAAALAHPTWVSAAAGISVILGALLRILPEEKLLHAQYPHYAAYAARTRRMLPGIF